MVGPMKSSKDSTSGSKEANTTPPRKADVADLKAINSFKTAVGDATNQRNKQIESAL